MLTQSEANYAAGKGSNQPVKLDKKNRTSPQTKEQFAQQDSKEEHKAGAKASSGTA